MSEGGINKANVGRIAERIVANELEFRGFRVTDLNKEGIATNADLLAARGGKTWQIQVKGSSWDRCWWFNYGFCNEMLIQDGKRSVFNRATSFYEAQIIILVCAKSAREYVCIVMPLVDANRAAQLNLELFRMEKRDGTAKKPGKMWCYLDYIPKTKNERRRQILEKEQLIIRQYEEAWHIFDEA